MAEHCIDSPLGPLTLIASNGAITDLRWRKGGTDQTPELLRGAEQLHAYFEGDLKTFDLPLRVDASDFQRAVCDQMSAIPFGETRTYGDIAKTLGVPAQAVGGGCGGNPIAIIIPCHRVLGATSLGGFSGMGGIDAKVWLLRHEGAAGLLI